MIKLFYTSDTHFGHKNVIKYCNRPFSSVDEMNRIMIDNWNETVSDDDIVYHLGDVAMGQIADSLPLIGELNGHKILIPGNHDRVFPTYKEDHRQRFMEEYLKYFNEVFPVEGNRGKYIDEHEQKSQFIMCHFPYFDVRYSSFSPVDEGLPLLHGHVHNEWETLGTQFNVGVDVHDFRPVSEEEIIDWLRSIRTNNEKNKR